MKNLQFPMILTHRTDPHAQIVVANAEQYAEAPEEFKPQLASGDVGTASPALTAAAAIPGVNLDAGTSATVDSAEDAERRQSLNEAVDEFTAHVQAETTKIDAARAQIEQDRAALREQTAALNEQMEALARERAEFEAQRTAAAGSTTGTGETAGETGADSASAEGAATGDAATSTPAKRTRGAAKAEG